MEEEDTYHEASTSRGPAPPRPPPAAASAAGGVQPRPSGAPRRGRPPRSASNDDKRGDGSSGGSGGGGGPVNKTNCLVCGDEAIRHVHYGGRCCFSCKAFFRRAVNWQNAKQKSFVCKSARNCDINIKTRKCCQHCRFQVGE